MIEVNYLMGHEDYNYADNWSPYPNSAGLVGVKFSIKNVGEKTIKYYSLYFVPYNAVGDKVGCTIRDRVEYGIRGTGPLANGQVETGNYLEDMWYNPSITSVKLTRAEIQYMDGTSETIQGSQISSIQSAGNGGCCYVATAVYGTYDCPEVWTLRRFRDYELGETWYGRAFIKLYYTISPILVRQFGETNWFKNMWRGTLDRMVSKLQRKGFESTPYRDKDWN